MPTILPSLPARYTCQSWHVCATEQANGLQYTIFIRNNIGRVVRLVCILTTGEQVQQLVDEYIHFYNFQRIDMKKGLTPFEIRSKAA